MKEKRKTVRSRVFFGAEIAFDSELPPVECHVKNLSGEGARIVVLSGEPLPNQFYLTIRKTNERRHAVVAWSKARELGLAYRAPSERNWSSPSALRQFVSASQA